jgi:hypothetical protein
MPQIELYEVRDGYICFFAVGQADMAQWIALQKQAMTTCKENSLTKLMIDTTQVTGPYLNTVDRFRAAVELEKFWDRRMWLAVVSTEEQIAPDKIGVLSANNRGVRANVFTSQTDAEKWLLNE